MSITIKTAETTFTLSRREAVELARQHRLYLPAQPTHQLAEFTARGIVVTAINEMAIAPDCGGLQRVHAKAPLNTYLAVVRASMLSDRYFPSGLRGTLVRRAIWDLIECYSPGRLFTYLRQHVPARWL